MAGGSAKFYSGAIAVQAPEALDAFVRAAEAGNSFVYCEAPEPQRTAEGWLRAGELAREGLIRLCSRRRAGGGWQYYCERTGKALPKRLDPQEKALSSRATRIIYDQLKREANFDKPCSSDTALAEKAGLTMRQQASQHFRKLIAVELIRSELVYDRGVPARVVTILPSDHAGTAAGKFTALPAKWRALRQAAERELRAADDADLARLRRAGL